MYETQGSRCSGSATNHCDVCKAQFQEDLELMVFLRVYHRPVPCDSVRRRRCVHHGGSVFNRFNASKIFPKSSEDRHSKARDVLVCWVSALEVYRQMAHLCARCTSRKSSKFQISSLFKSKADSVALFPWIFWAVAHSAKPCNRARSVWCTGVC